MRYSEKQIEAFTSDVERYFSNYYNTKGLIVMKPFIRYYANTDKFIIDHEPINRVTKNPNLYKFLWQITADKVMPYLIEHLSPMMEKHRILVKDIVLLLYDMDDTKRKTMDRICHYTNYNGQLTCDRLIAARF